MLYSCVFRVGISDSAHLRVSEIPTASGETSRTHPSRKFRLPSAPQPRHTQSEIPTKPQLRMTMDRPLACSQNSHPAHEEATTPIPA